MDATTNRSLNILVVDDDPSTVELYATVLNAAGHRTHTRTSSTAALAEIEALDPEVLVLDIMMPGMDGLELCQRVREMPQFADLKIVVVSAKTYEIDRKRALKMGANGFLSKPINTETFTDEIMQFVEDKIDLTFWGVRGTLPVPGSGSLRYGGNTSCVTAEFSDGRYFIFDAGSGIKGLSDHLVKNEAKRIEAKVFISHSHWDHINALPFFVPLYNQGNEFEVMGPSQSNVTMRELISAQMDDVYFPIALKDFAARIFFRNLREETIEIGDVRVDTCLLSHPGACLGYRITYKDRSFCYVTDNELFVEGDPAYNPLYRDKLISFVEGTDVLITDTTYTDEEYRSKVGWGHSCVGEVVGIAHRAGVKGLYLFHHDPDQDDDAIEAKWQDACRQLDELNSSTKCLLPAEGDSLSL